MLVFNAMNIGSVEKVKARLRQELDRYGIKVGRSDDKIERILAKLFYVPDINTMKRRYHEKSDATYFELASLHDVHQYKRMFRKVMADEGIRLGSTNQKIDNIMPRLLGLRDIDTVYGLAKKRSS